MTVHLWDAARLWLWIHPWAHAFIVGTPVLIGIILTIWGLHHSREANCLSEEANDLRKEQKDSIAKIAEIQGERNRLQTDLNKSQVDLNKLQAERNESLGQIAANTTKVLSEAEKNAAKLLKHIGETAYVTDSNGGSWGGMGAIIGEVKDEIVELLICAGSSSSRATGNFVRCDKLHLIESPMGGCTVKITVLERYNGTVDYGEAKTWAEAKAWAERNRAPTAPRPRGGNVFSAIYRKEGIGPTRNIHVYDPTNGNRDFTLVTRDKDGQEETGIFYCNGVKELATKFNVIQLEWVIDKWRWSGGNDNKALFLFTK